MATLRDLYDCTTMRVYACTSEMHLFIFIPGE